MDTLFELEDLQPRPTKHRRQLHHALEQYSQRGLTLQEISKPAVLGISIPTLRGYARRLGLAFPDYTPRALRKCK